ncbi:MAG: hypothetical protein AAFR87_24680 [Bacteroidota bacterium]
MDGKSLDITEDKKQQLKQLFPEIFSEDKIDFEKLKLILGKELYCIYNIVVPHLKKRLNTIKTK